LVYNYRIITIGKRFEKRFGKNDLIKYLKNDPEPPTTILLEVKINLPIQRKRNIASERNTIRPGQGGEVYCKSG